MKVNYRLHTGPGGIGTKGGRPIPGPGPNSPGGGIPGIGTPGISPIYRPVISTQVMLHVITVSSLLYLVCPLEGGGDTN